MGLQRMKVTHQPRPEAIALKASPQLCVLKLGEPELPPFQERFPKFRCPVLPGDVAERDRVA